MNEIQNYGMNYGSTFPSVNGANGSPVLAPIGQNDIMGSDALAQASVGQTGADQAAGGMNWGNVSDILGGIAQLGNLWNAWQSNKLAGEQFDFQKDAYKTNLKNQTKSYNTALADRINARYGDASNAEAKSTEYLNKHSL